MNAGPGGARPDQAGLPPAPEVRQIEVGLLQNFCEILFCRETGLGAVVDPAWEADRLLREAQDLGVRLAHVLVTHTHEDHVEGVAEVVAATGAHTYVHPAEAARVRSLLGGGGEVIELADGQDVAIGRCGVRAIHTPGHTVGGTCYLADGYLITGDVLFVRGCGRTDFPGGDTAALWSSLQRLLALPEETVVYPGHNYGPTPTSTLSSEALQNPFLRCPDLAGFRSLRERRR